MHAPKGTNALHDRQPDQVEAGPFRALSQDNARKVPIKADNLQNVLPVAGCGPHDQYTHQYAGMRAPALVGRLMPVQSLPALWQLQRQS